MLKNIYEAGGVRTPIGSFSGTLSEVPAPNWPARLSRAALELPRIPAAQVQEVIVGNVQRGWARTSLASRPSPLGFPSRSAPPRSTRSAAPGSRR